MKIEFEKISNIREIRSQIAELQKANADPRTARGTMAAEIGTMHPESLWVTVDRITPVTPTCKCFRFKAAEGTLPYFRPGQYVNVKVNVNGIRTSRSYSISSSPSEREYYEISVRRKARDSFVSDYLLDEVKPGDRLEISGPSGSFYYRRPLHGDDLVLLAGGSGITPFMSMLRFWAAQKDFRRTIHLIYGSNRIDDVPYLEELRALDRKMPGFSLHLVIAQPEEGYTGLTGFITADVLDKILGNVKGKRFFLCGPDGMHGFVLPELEKLGVDPHSVDREAHAPEDAAKLPDWPADVHPDTTFTVQIEGGRSFPVRAGDTLLSSLERNGIVLLSNCRAGECAYCRTKLLAGNVVYPRTTWIRKADVASRYIHPCVAYPVSDVVLRIHTAQEV